MSPRDNRPWAHPWVGCFLTFTLLMFGAAPAFAQDEDQGGETGGDGDEEDGGMDAPDPEPRVILDEEDETATNLVVEPELKEGEERPIEWFPGWDVGARVGWLFTSLDNLNEPVFELQGNDIESIDASGILRVEALGGPYISKKARIDAIFGGAVSTGSQTAFSMWYLGIEPAVVFPEHRFEFHLGLKALLGGYSFEGNAVDTGSKKGYEGTGLVIEPNLTFRYIPTMELGIDLSLGFWQFIALDSSPTGGAIDLDSASAASDNPLDWAAPSITLGVVFGQMPTRPEVALSPSGDADKDGIINKDDECPRKAEDIDGFEDENGCPDTDNDKDGRGDAVDKCPDQAEDEDGIADDDGCPETDADNDGLLDEKDKCPVEAEDKDGFEDTDGCPDTDNDKDGIEDSKDKCPNDPEDKDGFEDEDGCPDIDDDKDYVPDDVDQCKGEAETWNGVKDEDGCPDADAAQIQLEDRNVVFSKPFPFGKKADLSDDAKATLDQVAVLLVNAKHLAKVGIEVHTDDKGDEEKNMKISTDRAAAIRDYLIEKGVDATRLSAKGFGESQPLVPTDDLKGKELDEARAKNKRLVIKVNKMTPPPTFTPRGTAPAPEGQPEEKKDDQ